MEDSECGGWWPGEISPGAWNWLTHVLLPELGKPFHLSTHIILEVDYPIISERTEIPYPRTECHYKFADWVGLYFNAFPWDATCSTIREY